MKWKINQAKRNQTKKGNTRHKGKKTHTLHMPQLMQTICTMNTKQLFSLPFFLFTWDNQLINLRYLKSERKTEHWKNLNFNGGFFFIENHQPVLCRKKKEREIELRCLVNQRESIADCSWLATGNWQPAVECFMKLNIVTNRHN